jgi:hypothetical protein
VTGAARAYAVYLFEQNLLLAAMLLLFLASRVRRTLAGFIVLTALLQRVDVINGLARGAFLLVPGLLVFDIVFLAGAWRLSGLVVWHVMPGSRKGVFRPSPT